MNRRALQVVRTKGWALAALVCAVVLAVSLTGQAQQAPPEQQYGIAIKRPIMQAACMHCPWGALADMVKKAMSFYGYDVTVCYTCSGVNSTRIVSRRLVAPDIGDREFGHGIRSRPNGTIDFGVTQSENVRNAYEGVGAYQNDPSMKNLRAIARIEDPAYLMIAAPKSSGITDLRQISEKKMPVRIMLGPSRDVLAEVLAYFGITENDVKAWGGRYYAGNALWKNPDFDLILGVGVLSNYPEGNMWYEMTQKKDLLFFQIPDELRQKIAKEHRGELVDLPFRYLRGVGDDPIHTVGLGGLTVYGRDDLPDQFVTDVAKAIDEKHGLLKWTNMPFSYDPATVWDGAGVPLHQAAERYYRERGYMK